MKFTQEGEWTVGTPVVAGFAGAISAATQCVHPVWHEDSRQLENGVLMVMERCTGCKVAVRAKYRPIKEGDSEVNRESRL